MTDDPLRIARDHLQALGFPADDLPDRLVPLVAEMAGDKARLDWVVLRRAEIERTWSQWAVRWSVRYLNLQGTTDMGQSHDSLRAAIDAARTASAPEEAEQERRLAEMRAGPVHIERHPPARPHPFRRGGPLDGR